MRVQTGVSLSLTLNSPRSSTLGAVASPSLSVAGAGFADNQAQEFGRARPWRDEKRIVLAAANRDREALLRENKRLWVSIVLVYIYDFVRHSHFFAIAQIQI